MHHDYLIIYKDEHSIVAKAQQSIYAANQRLQRKKQRVHGDKQNSGKKFLNLQSLLFKAEFYPAYGLCGGNFELFYDLKVWFFLMVIMKLIKN